MKLRIRFWHLLFCCLLINLFIYSPKVWAQNQSPLLVKSNSSNGAFISQNYIKNGLNHSPPLQWINIPVQTQSLAIICADPDAPCGLWIHWLAWNIPPSLKSIEEACPKNSTLPNGMIQGRNSFGQIGYDGPSPPPGKLHHYYFTVYALNTKLNLRPGANYQEVKQAMAKHILCQGYFMGTYNSH